MILIMKTNFISPGVKKVAIRILSACSGYYKQGFVFLPDLVAVVEVGNAYYYICVHRSSQYG